MNDADSPTLPFSIRIAHPARLLAWLWLALGGLLFLTFFLPNFTMADMKITGPKLIDMLTRRDANIERIFDDDGFLMMVAVPLVYTLLAIATLVLGILALLGGKPKGVLVLAIAALFVVVFSIVGAIIIYNGRSEVLLFAKLLPKPAPSYWLALVVQFLIFAVSMGYWLLLRRQAAVQTVAPPQV